jgi:signal transduction histidine kinase
VKQKLLIGFLVLTTVSATAQNRNLIDSLKKVLVKSEGVTKFTVLNDLGFEYRLSYPDSTVYYCQQAYDLGVAIKIKKELARPLNLMGLARKFNGDYKGAFQFQSRAIEIAEQQQDSIQLGYSYNNFGRLFFDQGDISRAYDTFLKAKEMFEAINDQSGLAYVYRSLSDLYRSQSDYPKALDMSLQALKIRKSAGEPRGIISSLMELGTLYTEMKSKIDAARCFEQADSIALKLGDKISDAEIKIKYAEFLVNNDQEQKAEELANAVYEFIERTKNVRLLPQALLLKGIVDYRKGELNKAIVFFNRVIAITEKSHLDLQRDAYFYLSKIFEKQGKQAEATQATIKYLILKESLQNIELARQIEKLQFQLEIEKKEKENEQLKASEIQKEAIIKQQRLENVILVVIAGFTTVLFVLQYRNSKKRRETNQKLARQNAEIEKQDDEIKKQNEKLYNHNQMLSELNHEKDTLMSIVAHDLKSPLNRIKGLVDLIELSGAQLNDEQRKYISLIKESTRSGVDLITDLLDVNSLEVNREPNFSIFDLNKFIDERINIFRQHALAKQIDIKFESKAKDLVFLDQEYLARIMDNLLSNAIKFSPKESLVSVTLGEQGGYFYISIKDQGPGFTDEDQQSLFQKFKKLSARPTAGESSNGLGLAIVKTLVDRLDGEIELKTQVKQGSEFFIRFPLRDRVGV